MNEKLCELKAIIDWLIDGYRINLILKNNLTKNITKEWIIENYNVELSYFDKYK